MTFLPLSFLILAGIAVPTPTPRAPGPPHIPAPMRTMSPEQRQRLLSRVNAYIVPSQIPDEFVLRISPFGRPEDGISMDASPNDVQFEALDSHEVPVPGASFQVLSALPPLQYPESAAYRAFGLHIAFRFVGPHRGMYTLRAHAPVRSVRFPGGSVVPQPAIANTIFYQPDPPDSPATLRLGQPFLVLPQGTEEVFDDRVHAVARDAVALHVATLKEIEPGGLLFRLDSGKTLRAASAGDVTSIPSFVPIVTDPTQRAMERKYVGHPVWGFGGLGATCIGKEPGTQGAGDSGNSTPYFVKRIVRLAGGPYQLSIGSYGAIGGQRESEFTTVRPLLVVFTVPATARFGARIWSSRAAPPRTPPGPGTRSPRSPIPDLQGACAGFYDLFSDDWDLERTLSLRSPEKAHPEWSKSVIANIYARKLQAGMTHDMVGWVRGYPSEYGTAAELAHISAWKYDDLSPFNYWVYFAGDRVVRFGPDGQLP